MTRSKGAPNWTEAEDDRLRHLWGGGMTAADIALSMGRESRSAVLGRVRRLKLPYRRNPNNVAKPKYPQKRTHKGDSSLARVIRAKVMPMLPRARSGDKRSLVGKAWNALPDSTPITLVELRDGLCRWPIGQDKPFLFCGLPCGPETYCEHHAAMSVGVGTESERRAGRQMRVAA